MLSYRISEGGLQFYLKLAKVGKQKLVLDNFSICMEPEVSSGEHDTKLMGATSCITEEVCDTSCLTIQFLTYCQNRIAEQGGLSDILNVFLDIVLTNRTGEWLMVSVKILIITILYHTTSVKSRF